MRPIPSSMKAPGDFRPGIWRGRVLQVKIINSCDLDCKNCSVAVGLVKKLKKQFRMTPDQFREALRSLKGFPGVIGMFGGNPCIHPDFPELCAIFREEIPNKDQRGLWSNRLFGHGKVCRETFGPHCNLNVHESLEAWDEIRRDWPEANPLNCGLGEPSRHGPIFGSMLDLEITENTMWERIGKCYVNQTWSAEITVVEGELLGYFCEVAATMAELEGDPSKGYQLADGWWARGMPEFEGQVRHYCPRCLVAMNPRKIDAKSDAPEEYTATWAPILATIKGRPLREVSTAEELDGKNEPATRYLPKGVMPANV